MALMAFSDSKVYNDKTCSKTCLKNYETLKKQCDDLIVKLNQTEFTAATYKRGLATVEEQLITYRKNEALFSEEVAVLKREVSCKDYEINVLKISKDTSSFVESSLNVGKETAFPVDKKVEFVKPKNHEKPVKKSVRYAEMYRSHSPRGNQRNWNGQKSNQLGSDFVMYNKACFICGSFEHVHAHFNTAKAQAVNTARPKIVNTARPKAVNIARPHSAVVNVIRVNQANAVKPQQDDKGFVDSGCSRHMTRNIAYLSDFKEFDGGYVTFGGCNTPIFTI
ncbi:hypothetical protein Tco_1577484 [Tanacetum coccineum]